MKKVDFNKLQAGDLVEVPRTQFAPVRRGWNGWLFSEAVVIRKGVGRNILKKYGIEDAESFYKFIERDDVTGCDWIRFLIEKGFLFNE